MDNKIKHILGEYKTRESVNKDAYFKVQFNNSERLLPPGEINKVLDVGEQFNRERQECPYYRIYGKINPLISNVLFNLTGADSWQTFSTRLFINNTFDSDDEYLTYEEAIKKHLKEIDGWYGYFDPDFTKAALCEFYDMEPKRKRFSFIPDRANPTSASNSSVKNWELTITYPYSADTKHPLINGGILLVQKEDVIVGSRKMTALSVPVSHNLEEGDIVRLTGTTNDKDYVVKRVGLDNGDLKKYFFCIDIDPTTIDIGANSRMIKIVNDIPCQYYFRKFKKIKTKSSAVIETDDYEVFKLAFSENIYVDAIEQFVFNEDIDVSDLTDNLGRPLSELYLTIIKTDSNNIFTKVSSGIESPYLTFLNTANNNQYLKNIPVIQKIHNVSSAPSQTFTALELDVKVNDNDFYGDVVEYNLINVEEVVLSDVYYRFSTINRETSSNTTVNITNTIIDGGTTNLSYTINAPRPEGYYYKAHHLIRIRDYSNYIEEGDENTQDKPDYSVNLGDGRYVWRDLLDIGSTDVKTEYVDYPFLNGAHYMYNSYCFEVKRQDPFDNWDMYYSKFPADPIGNTTNLKFKLNSSDNVC
jgi:hypothetical protein